MTLVLNFTDEETFNQIISSDGAISRCTTGHQPTLRIFQVDREHYQNKTDVVNDLTIMAFLTTKSYSSVPNKRTGWNFDQNTRVQGKN